MMLMTKPQTFAYGLNDSQVGIAFMIVEKYRAWSDCNSDIEKSFTKDELLTNIMLYWVSQLGGTAVYGYALEGRNPSIKPGTRIDVPVALAIPPGDLTPVPPLELAERSLNVQHWTVLPHGGHFVALEDPKPLAEDMCAFFKELKLKTELK
jgi:pimeloyl-ACP methyl ester carboxylesterase